jgi:ubiquitin carboxyl-terminal hydrolase 14
VYEVEVDTSDQPILFKS